MKMFKFVFPLFLALFMFSSNQSNAQYLGDLPWFKLDNKTLNQLFVFEDMDINSTFSIPTKSKKNIVAVPKAALKDLGVTRVESNVKKINSPIVLKSNGNCYKVGCKKNSCSNCNLIWKDINNDKKIQPKKELRCVCLKTKEPCQIAGKKVPCTKD